MFHIVKLLAIVLAIAVPLRSYAAGVMLLCGPDHHSGMVAASSASQHDAGDHYRHLADDGTVTHEDPALTYADLATDHEEGAFSASACAGCGACCTGAIALQGFNPTPRITQTSEAIAFILHPFAGVVPENAERPPLTFVR